MTHEEAPAGTGATPIITDQANTSTILQLQIMPPLTADEYAALEASIAEHGVLTPVVVDESGVLIDGHHREEIAAKLGVKCMRRTVRYLTDEQKIAMALTLNVDRRHLSREQRRELLAMSIKAEPGVSDREHGRRTGTDNKTAAKVRSDLEGREEIPHVEKRTDAKGRRQPASKPKVDEVVELRPDEVARLDWNSIPATSQQKLEAMRRNLHKQYERLLEERMEEAERDFNSRIGEELQRRFEHTAKSYRELKAKTDWILNGRKGIVTKGEYKLILACLHPDSRRSVSDEKLAEAFRVFNAAEILFLSERDDPTPRVTLPTELKRRPTPRRRS